MCLYGTYLAIINPGNDIYFYKHLWGFTIMNRILKMVSDLHLRPALNTGDLAK